MTNFHEGQEVEVSLTGHATRDIWHKAKIIKLVAFSDGSKLYEVAFARGGGDIFDEEHIRPFSMPR